MLVIEEPTIGSLKEMCDDISQCPYCGRWLEEVDYNRVTIIIAPENGLMGRKLIVRKK